MQLMQKKRNIATKRKSLSGNVVPGLLRKNLKEKRLKLRSAVRNAIKHRMQIDCPINYKVAFLKKDIDNGPYHVFGCHDKCVRYTSIVLSFEDISILFSGLGWEHTGVILPHDIFIAPYFYGAFCENTLK
ncbi:hypothetical protein QTP88_028801 [Uroleucon formosanum]